MTDAPLPATGGSFIRDPETGELMLVDQTKPAPPPWTKAERVPAPDPAPADAPDAQPKGRKAVPASAVKET